MATIYGTSGHDQAALGGTDLIGTDQADYIYGYGGDDRIEGRGGNDQLLGGAGVNTILGGGGDDYVSSEGTLGWYDGGAGTDTLSFATIGSGGAFDLALGSGRFGATTPSGANAFTMQRFENFTAGSGNDIVWGTEGVNVLNGGNGNDTIFGRGGNDTIQGGAGNNELDGGAGNDYLFGSTGHDFIHGGSEHDWIEGGAGNDSLYGGAGNDTIKGGAGADIIDGLDGIDTASFAGLAAGIILDINGGTVRTPAGGGVEVDQIFRIEKVIGTSYADNMSAGATTELDGGSGDDFIASGSGANVLWGGAGTDMLGYNASTSAVNVNLNTGQVSGGHANGDSIWGFEGVRGSAYNDTLRANNAGSRLEGAGGDDTMTGGSGADIIVGGAGSDRLTGGGGADRFVFNFTSESAWASTNRDTITDFQKGLDRIDLSGIDANVQLGGNQAFTKVITSGQPYSDPNFTAGTISVWKATAADQTWVFLNTDNTDTGTGSNPYDAIEGMIILSGLHNLAASDFIL